VLVASSRSAKTALPSEQNQPGRRFAQAAHPSGDVRLNRGDRVCSSNEICMSAIVLPRSIPARPIASAAFRPSFLSAQAAGEVEMPGSFPFTAAVAPSLLEERTLWM
jgi:hypothetical protein